MEPIEINAGRYYLRLARADDRVDDRPALVAAGWAGPVEAGEHVARRAAGWRDGTACAWVVADPLTGGLLGEVVITLSGDGTGEIECWTVPSATDAADEAVGAVTRFGYGALGLGDIRVARGN